MGHINIMKRVLVVFGTRPEAIKMAPVVKMLKECPSLETKVCISSQHRELLLPVLELFDVPYQYDLDVMQPDQSLTAITVRILSAMESVLLDYKPDMVVVHGDTTTGFTAALSAFYHRVPVAHVEAGLRTGDLQAPWPEELNRKLIGSIATLNFAPTASAQKNLLQESISSERIYITGNTVIDALFFMREKIWSQPSMLAKLEKEFEFLNRGKQLLLVTGHRRESYGQGFLSICEALKRIALTFEDTIEIIYPVHLNPNVRKPVQASLGKLKNLYLIEPVDYSQFVYLMEKCHLILTDSGGVQEEAPAFGKPVLIMRNKTERTEAIEVGTARLVGTDRDTIVSNVEELLMRPECYEQMAQVGNPFGDGHAADRIVQTIAAYFEKS
jgi:UDP-N-acetylglucosamine 2-epimerase (non-hydrolysing)